MKSHARVVVIGGGVVGCSVLYHLTRFGWSDVVLLERSELTSGSTWHAAGGMHTINGDPNVAKLQKYTVDLYKEIQEYSGQDIGLHMTGGVMLAATPERFDWLKSILAKGKYLGLDAQMITPDEAAELFPLMDPSQFVGALYDEVEGHLDPYGTTHAYAKSAKKNGAEIELHTKVESLEQLPDGTWRVVTDKGDIVAEHVVNAAGLWAREVGRMVGLELPVLAMEHMYLLTQDMPEVAEFNAAKGREMLHAVDFDGELYLRQERKGMLMGTYEKACKPWSPRVTPWDFGHELLEPDLDRIAPSLEVGFRHFPAFENAGIKQVINGPFTFAPDGNPLVGPIRGLRGFWSACGVMAGFSQGGGVGLALSQWMVNGDPGLDVFAMDVSRFGDYATLSYTNAKVQENYARRFSIRFPNEELPAGRPLKTSPIYDLLKAEGAQFGASFGLESALWFAPEGVKDGFSWKRSTDFEHVGAEVRAVRTGVGIIETTGFAKYSVTGPGAEAWLDRLLAARIPVPGRMVLAPMLKESGRLIGDFTLANLGGGNFFVCGSGAAEEYHMRWFERHMDPGVTVTAHGAGLCGVSIAGPKSRELLAKVTGADVGNEAFRFMDIKRMDVGMAPCTVGRVSFTGDLGYEIWMGPEYQRHVYLALKEAGQSLGLKDFGLRALNALRLEKGFGGWAREYRPIYSPWEAELGRFVALDKEADFIGKSAASALKAEGGRMRLRSFVVEAEEADVIGDEPIFQGDDVVGWVTSGGFAHGSEVSVAMGYVPKEMAERAEGWAVEILGSKRPARLQRVALFDANGAAMRA
ncbi:GcvT family protein [Oceaniglobus roseus]|uniref:GcvT family protein n=1 Tax=Oceaniglobus roseus TaxID=1737570 RepID=UPI000C7F62E4|nr:FAD-dependent oxidoreductase [Kandeliimicrobium roseum]